MRGSRTPEREALLRAEYADAVDVGALLARVNALPGPALASRDALRVWACRLGLKKSPTALAALANIWHVAGGNASAERLAFATPRRVTWTPERIALLRAEYPAETDTPALLGRLNALPGPKIAGGQAVGMKAMRLGIGKTGAAKRAIRAEIGRNTRNLKRPTSRTPERLAVIAARYPTEIDAAALLDALNALPGPPLSGAGAVQSWAWHLHLRKTPETAAAIRLRYANGANIRAALSLERQERRKANERAREDRRKAKVAALTKAPPMQRSRILPPVAPAPAVEPVAVEQSPALADRVVERKHDMARRMIAKKKDAALIAQTCALPLREVFRLVGEIRMERHLNAAGMTA